MILNDPSAVSFKQTTDSPQCTVSFIDIRAVARTDDATPTERRFSESYSVNKEQPYFNTISFRAIVSEAKRRQLHKGPEIHKSEKDLTCHVTKDDKIPCKRGKDNPKSKKVWVFKSHIVSVLISSIDHIAQLKKIKVKYTHLLIS